jgi:galactokinase
MSKELIQRVKQRFRTQFDGDPLMVFSPGRINLIGEHTDYNDGFVFPAAIDLGIVLALKKSSSKISRVYALNKKEICEISLNQISTLSNGGWRNYVIGIIGELQKQGITIGNFEGVFAGNIPSGAGMSSSAALENSFVYGLNKLFNLGLKKKEMIFISQKAEHNFVGVHCGIMDQYASMLGKKKSALLLDCRTIKSTPYKLKLKKLKLVLVNTNVKHNLSESAYNNRRAVCEKVAKLLNVKTLRDATEKNLNLIKDKISKSDFNKALYVIRENKRVKEFAEAIKKQDAKLMGKLMYKTHEELSKNYKVSCEELDFLVEITKSMDFVYGSRMMGGGFGGCTINLVEQRNIDNFKTTIENKFKAIFNRPCSIYDVNISKGTHLI